MSVTAFWTISIATANTIYFTAFRKQYKLSRDSPLF